MLMFKLMPDEYKRPGYIEVVYLNLEFITKIVPRPAGFGGNIYMAGEDDVVKYELSAGAFERLVQVLQLK